MTEKQQEALRAKAEKQARRRAREEEREKALRERAAAAKSERSKRRLLHRAERHQIRANAHKVRGKQFTERAEGKINDQEWKRIARSRRNHRMYDAISAVTRRFLPKNPLREEGMEFTGPNGGQFTNQGRIFLGGTKAMNRFTDGAGKDWLCKEAVTCVGTYKPMGALVTEAASRLQEKISPDTAIRSFAYRGENGRVLGSLQERLDVKPDAFDLFKWQSDTSQAIPAHLPDQILREHVTDWLLCNFDTKGENFLEDSQGRLRGIDKEQALSFLDHKDAQHMSYKFSPNPNTTLYNSVFEQYAKGKMDLDLNQVDQYIRTVEAIPDEEYLGLFHDVVEAKCKGDPGKMKKMNDQILGRKNGLRAEYQRFFGELARERGANELVDEAGSFVFGAADGPAKQGPSAEKETPAKQGPAVEQPAAQVQQQAPAAAQQGLDRSQYEKPLTLEESLQAQRLQTQLMRAVRSIDRQMDQPGVTPERRDALGEVKTAAETIKDYNAKRLVGRITREESVAFHQLLDPAHAKDSGARPEVVKFTQELRQVMAPEKEISAKAAVPKVPVREAPQLSRQTPKTPSLGRR